MLKRKREFSLKFLISCCSEGDNGERFWQVIANEAQLSSTHGEVDSKWCIYRIHKEWTAGDLRILWEIWV